jgi:hypothetical protein
MRWSDCLALARWGSPSGILERLSVGHASLGRGRGRGCVEDEDEDVGRTKGVAVVVDACTGEEGGACVTHCSNL